MPYQFGSHGQSIRTQQAMDVQFLPSLSFEVFPIVDLLFYFSFILSCDGRCYLQVDIPVFINSTL